MDDTLRSAASRARLVGLCVAVLLCGLLAGCRWPWEPDPGAAALVLSGTVDARQVDLSFQAGGRIARLLTDEGQTVQAGRAGGRTRRQRPATGGRPRPRPDPVRHPGPGRAQGRGPPAGTRRGAGGRGSGPGRPAFRQPDGGPHPGAGQPGFRFVRPDGPGAQRRRCGRRPAATGTAKPGAVACRGAPGGSGARQGRGRGGRGGAALGRANAGLCPAGQHRGRRRQRAAGRGRAGGGGRPAGAAGGRTLASLGARLPGADRPAARAARRPGGSAGRRAARTGVPRPPGVRFAAGGIHPQDRRNAGAAGRPGVPDQGGPRRTRKAC